MTVILVSIIHIFISIDDLDYVSSSTGDDYCFGDLIFIIFKL